MLGVAGGGWGVLSSYGCFACKPVAQLPDSLSSGPLSDSDARLVLKAGGRLETTTTRGVARAAADEPARGLPADRGCPSCADRSGRGDVRTSLRFNLDEWPWRFSRCGASGLLRVAQGRSCRASARREVASGPSGEGHCKRPNSVSSRCCCFCCFACRCVSSGTAIAAPAPKMLPPSAPTSPRRAAWSVMGPSFDVDCQLRRSSTKGPVPVEPGPSSTSGSGGI